MLLWICVSEYIYIYICALFEILRLTTSKYWLKAFHYNFSLCLGKTSKNCISSMLLMLQSYMWANSFNEASATLLSDPSFKSFSIEWLSRISTKNFCSMITAAVGCVICWKSWVKLSKLHSSTKHATICLWLCTFEWKSLKWMSLSMNITQLLKLLQGITEIFVHWACSLNLW